MPIRSLIIDDDPFIHDLLQDKLALHFPDIEVVGLAEGGETGARLIRDEKPDLVFLDVEMQDMTGFEMLQQLGRIDFQTIFITSYSHYAIKAIRFNALDYILKPLDLGELKQAIKRFKLRKAQADGNEGMQAALRNMRTSNALDQTFVLQLQDGEIRVPLKDLIRLEGERNYTYVYLANKRRTLCAKTLGDFEELLSDKGFFRCHKSHLVHAHHIQSVPNKFQLISSDGAEIPISRRKATEFKNWYGELRG